MQRLIKPNHSSFITSRYISDNVILAQEAIHTMKTTKSKKGWMAIKVDLEKAYDQIRWDFLSETLSDIGLPNFLIRIIMTCVITVSMQLLWNGTISEAFVPTRGVR